MWLNETIAIGETSGALAQVLWEALKSHMKDIGRKDGFQNI